MFNVISVHFSPTGETRQRKIYYSYHSMGLYAWGVREIMTGLVMKISVTIMVHVDLMMAVLENIFPNISEGTVCTNKFTEKH